MIYKEIKIETTEKGLDYITELLEELEIYGSVVNSKSTIEEILNKKESYEWDYVNPEVFLDDEKLKTEIADITFYVEEDKESILKELYKKLADLRENHKNIDFGTLEISENTVEDVDWIEAYKSTLKPVYIGDKIVIVPTWWDTVAREGMIEIFMDPGMAFGTGDHPTTFMCAKLMIEEDCKGKDVLDVGTGSGILGIIADKLGAQNILGVDIDNMAVGVAKENGKINNCKDNVVFQYGDLTKGIDFRADIVVGNLMAEVVVMLAESVGLHLKKDGAFISSGILVEKEDMVIKALKDAGLTVEKIERTDEWSCILARKIYE